MEEKTDKSFSLGDFLADLASAGIREGDIVTVHSSMKSVGGFVEGGPETVVEAFVRTVGPRGAVLFPSLTFRGSVTEFSRTVTRVDLREFPSCNGAITVAASRYPGATRSLHPTHPVIGIGAVADLFSGDQDGEGPCGVNSPFYRAAMAGGKIALLGVTNVNNTTLHCLEELYAPYIFIGEIFSIETVGMDGRVRTLRVKGYPVSTPRNFNAVEPVLLEAGVEKMGKFGGAELRVIDAKPMVSLVADLLRKDPFFLTKKN